MFRIGVMTAAAVITLSTATALAQSSSTPSLGELARQTEQKRAASKPATKVYTNADLAPKPDEAAPATPTAAAPATGGYVSKSTGEVLSAEEMQAASQEKLARDNAKMDEKWWRNQAPGLRSELTESQGHGRRLPDLDTPQRGDETDNRQGAGQSGKGAGRHREALECAAGIRALRQRPAGLARALKTESIRDPGSGKASTKILSEQRRHAAGVQEHHGV